MKANKYIQPIVEVMTVNAAYTICAESVFGGFNYGGSTNGTTINPEDDGR